MLLEISSWKYIVQEELLDILKHPGTIMDSLEGYLPLENSIWDLVTFSLASENKHSSSPKYGIREEMHLEIFCRAS